MPSNPVEVPFQTILDVANRQREVALNAVGMDHAREIAQRDQVIAAQAKQVGALTARIEELEADVAELTTPPDDQEDA